MIANQPEHLGSPEHTYIFHPARIFPPGSHPNRMLSQPTQAVGEFFISPPTILTLPAAIRRANGSVDHRYTSPVDRVTIQVRPEGTLNIHFGTNSRDCLTPVCRGCEGCVMPSITVTRTHTNSNPHVYLITEAHIGLHDSYGRAYDTTLVHVATYPDGRVATSDNFDREDFVAHMQTFRTALAHASFFSSQELGL